MKKIKPDKKILNKKKKKILKIEQKFCFENFNLKLFYLFEILFSLKIPKFQNSIIRKFL